MAAWMVTFVPVIAGAVIFGMDRLMTITGTSPGSKEAERAGDAASKGNATLGSLSFGQQQVADFRTDPGMSTTTSTGGTTIRDMISGAARYQHSMSSGPVSMQDMSRLSSERAQASSTAWDASRSEMKSAESATQAARDQINSFVKSGFASSRTSQAWKIANGAENSERTGDEQATSERLAKRLGTTDVVTVEKAIEAGLSTPVLLDTLGIKAGAKGATADRSNAEIVANEELNALQSRNINRSNAVMQKFMNEHGSEFVSGHEKRSADEIRASLSQSNAYRTSSDAKMTEAQRYQEDARLAAALSRSWSYSLDRELYEHYAREGLNPNDPLISQERFHASTLRFLRSGMIKTGDDGLPVFTIPHGLNYITEHRSEALKRSFEAYTPGGGRGSVLDKGAQNSQFVHATASGQGVSADGGRGGGGAARQEAEHGMAQSKAQIDNQREAVSNTIGHAQRSVDGQFKNAPGQVGSAAATFADGNAATRASQQRPRMGSAEVEKENREAEENGKRLDSINKNGENER